MSHSSRQEAFKAKAKATGGKGGMRGGGEKSTGGIPAKPKIARSMVTMVPKAQQIEAAAKEIAKAPKVKTAVPGKKAEYLLQKALRQKKAGGDKTKSK